MRIDRLLLRVWIEGDSSALFGPLEWIGAFFRRHSLKPGLKPRLAGPPIIIRLNVAWQRPRFFDDVDVLLRERRRLSQEAHERLAFLLGDRLRGEIASHACDTCVPQHCPLCVVCCRQNRFIFKSVTRFPGVAPPRRRPTRLSMWCLYHSRVNDFFKKICRRAVMQSATPRSSPLRISNDGSIRRLTAPDLAALISAPRG